jgi:hypothetical protein
MEPHMVIMLVMIVGPMLVILGCCIACIYVWKCMREDNYEQRIVNRNSIYSHKLEQNELSNTNVELENITIE